MNPKLKFALNIGTFSVSLIGGITGIWGAYTVHDASRFSQPFTERVNIIKSFNSQIESAKARNDTEAEFRVRLLLEKFEEDWRSSILLSNLVRPIKSLSTIHLSDADIRDISLLLAGLQGSPANVAISPETLGSAYFVVGDYPEAIEQLNLVSDQPGAWRAGMIKAAAYAQLASEEENQEEASTLKAASVNSYVSAQMSPDFNEEQTSRFVGSNPVLMRLLNEEGIGIYNQLEIDGKPISSLDDESGSRN